VRILIDYRPALRERSGVGEYTHQLAKALADRGRAPAGAKSDEPPLDVSIFSSSWKDRLHSTLPGVTAVDRRIPVSLLNLAWHRLRWPPVEALTGRTYDVVHSLHPLLLPSRSAAQVVTIHDLHFLTHPERTRAEIRRDYPPLVRAHAHRADAIVVPSRFTASEVERRLDVPSVRIAVCPPGAPDWAPRPVPPAAGQGYILFLGTLEPRKNVGLLVDAYERLLARRADLPRLVLAGRASDEARVLLDRITRVPLAGHVEHLGYVQPDDRQRVYAGALMLVLPSYEEGFGIPALEAMTAGVPVIVARAGALPEVVGEAGVVIDPEDADALSVAIDRMLADEPFAASCAAKGVLRSRDFNWQATADAVVSAYRGALVARRERRTNAERGT
jgi:glycosyltransferase involved in cell wall biosynthesis